jgi:hypothetical protein
MSYNLYTINTTNINTTNIMRDSPLRAYSMLIFD